MSDKAIKINCRNCRAKYDVSGLPPFTRFICPECGTVIRTPKPFGRYYLEKLCGKGGMSEIYRAIDPVLLRRVAIKIAHSPDSLELFHNEAKLLAPISHATILPLYDCGDVDGIPFIVMQYMDGGDLEFHMKKNSLPPTEKLIGYLREIAGGLNFLYLNHKIVHHDVKPANIMLTRGDEAKIGDFDFVDTRKTGDITTGCPEWGSPGYISPERLQYGGEDHRGDIYSLGITIYELLTGKLPFGIHGTPEELFKRRQEAFVPLITLRPDVGREISQLIDGMLEFDFESRPSYPEIIRSLHL